MEGLEISEVNFSVVMGSDDEFRWDAEFYKKEYIKSYEVIKKYPNLSDFVNMADVTSNGSFALVKSILSRQGGVRIPYVRSGNVGSGFIDETELSTISSEASKLLPKSITKIGDIIMARKGKIGGASIVTEQEAGWNVNENVVRMEIKSSKKDNLNPNYLMIYLSCKFGLDQVYRQATGNVQPWLSMYQLRKIKISLLSFKFQQRISELVLTAHSLYLESNNLYKEAETSILSEFDILNFEGRKQVNKPYNEKSLKDSFESSGRLDAEYYQSKYDLLFSKIKKTDNTELRNIVGIVKSIEPGSSEYMSEGIPFVRVSNLSKFEIKSSSIYLSKEKFDVEGLRPKKNTILFSKDGTVGIAHQLREDASFITSSAILHLIPDPVLQSFSNVKILPEYLTIILNSPIVQMQAERDAGGSIIQHWRIS